MNYLAHSFLSGNDTGLIIGNFIADHISGNHFEAINADIVQGILLHRRIDTFTDQHSLFKESKRVFYNGFEKYSGILVDLYFDHLLARNFSKFSKIALSDYCTNIYSIYKQNDAVMDTGSRNFLKYVLQNNIYEAYGTQEGISRVLFHLSQRIQHNVKLQDSFALFKKEETLLEENFINFFKEAVANFSNETFVLKT